MSDIIKLFLIWLGIPIIGALISYILGCLVTRHIRDEDINNG